MTREPKKNVASTDDIWAGYDPEKVEQAIREYAGVLTEEEAERAIAALYEARARGSRSARRP